VLGATVPEILLLLFRQFSTLIFISFVVATPISYYIMSNWLQDFAYRAPVGIGPFLLSGVLMLLISMITVSYYTLKMAFLNPVKGLKYE
jgi:putative ABC transport system permease protein